MSVSDYGENKIADAICGNATFTTPSNTYMKLHIGDPGEAGTANAASYTTRVEVTWGAASGGVCLNDAAVTHTMTASETISYFSIWDNLTAGNCLGSGALTASQAVVATNILNFAIGAVSFTQT